MTIAYPHKSVTEQDVRIARKLESLYPSSKAFHCIPFYTFFNYKTFIDQRIEECLEERLERHLSRWLP